MSEKRESMMMPPSSGSVGRDSRSGIMRVGGELPPVTQIWDIGGAIDALRADYLISKEGRHILFLSGAPPYIGPNGEIIASRLVFDLESLQAEIGIFPSKVHLYEVSQVTVENGEVRILSGFGCSQSMLKLTPDGRYTLINIP